MHYVIDDFVWVAIGVAVVAFLFMLGAAYIFLEEGIKRLVRSFRKPARVTLQNSAISTSTGKFREIPQGRKLPILKPNRSARLTLWRTIRSKVHGAKSGTFHIGHHKPANAKS